MNKYWILNFCLYYILFYFKTKKNLQMLQQNRYNRGNKYLKWLIKNLKKEFPFSEIIAIIIGFSLLSSNNLFYLFFTLYFICSNFIIYVKRKQEVEILPLNYTKRILRLWITIFLLFVIFLFMNLYLTNPLKTMILLLIPLGFNNIFLLFANTLNFPIEKAIYYSYKKKTMKKLQNHSNMEVIGITGSYGKTSSKNILTTILNTKYNAYATPKNYNTPYGLMITINDYLDPFNDYFIAEMGACKCHEIKELCNLAKPKYGILTKIGLAHLETFGSQENIQKTKFELIESLPKDGIGILNADDALQTNYPLNANGKILWIGIENKEKADVYATNINISPSGTSFTCHFKKEKDSIKCSTKLLGKANIYNILAAIALGKELGLTNQELKLGINAIKPTEHRLELKTYKDMYLLDDAYNANIEGAKMALDVLNQMPGKKIVVSSGMIELGKKNYEINKELGEQIAKIADQVILIGKEQTSPIYDGLLKEKFNNQNIYVVKNINEALNHLKRINNEETYILLQSDLPDIYNEK